MAGRPGTWSGSDHQARRINVTASTNTMLAVTFTPNCENERNCPAASSRIFACGVPIRAGALALEDQTFAWRKPRKLSAALLVYSGLPPGLGEAPERGVPGLEVGNGVFDVECGHGGSLVRRDVVSFTLEAPTQRRPSQVPGSFGC